MTALEKNFKKLLDAAAAKNKVVAKHRSFDTKAYKTEAQLRKALSDLGNTIGKELDEAGFKPENVGEDVIQLAKFFDSIKPQYDPFDCKPPLDISDLTFDQIAGQEEVKEQLSINYIQPFVYPKLFPVLAKGTLLYGPPGGGKTLLAKAATAELKKAAYFAPSPAELKGKYEGETEKNIRTVFDCASSIVDDPDTEYEFAIIFFDEFDGIAGKRGEDASMVRSVNSILQAMDGIKSSAKVSVLAATNYPWNLDDAILRRFNTRILVDLPDPPAIEYLIRKELASVYSDPSLDTKEKLATIRDGTKKNDNDYALNAPYIKNIKKYGGYEGKGPAGWFGGPKTVDKYIDDEYITKLVGMFGPNPTGKKVIEEVKSGKDVKTDDARLDTPTHIFGFSASDITKIMQEAVKYAAVRSLHGRAEKKAWGATSWWITTTENVGEKVANLPEDERDKVINFDIRQSDVEQAMKNLPSTIDNVKYLEIFKYAKQG